MEGCSQVASKCVDLLAEVARLGGGWRLGSGVEELHLPARCKGRAGLGTVLHGRQLRSGQKRGACVGKTKKGKGTKWMVVADGQGLPVGGTLSSASPAEVTLVVQTLADCKERTGRLPQRLIADRAYDADWLRNLMRRLDGELICPHRRNRKRASLQDGRVLRRYRHRWKIERLFAWLGNWRRLLVRHERRIDLYSGFFKLACIMILVRHF